MNYLKIDINKIKNIDSCHMEIPIVAGVYCLVGVNGCGKSTIMSCIGQTVFSSSLNILKEGDYYEDSYVNFEYMNNCIKWVYVEGEEKWKYKIVKGINNKFNGIYEGSLFYGTRFADSMRVDELIRTSKITKSDIVDADKYVKDTLSYILHGNYTEYRQLKRIRNKTIAREAGLKNTPYFQVFDNTIVSQYRMSSGECLLVSLLHFIYNALIRKSLPVDKPILMLVDEIELALHPVAVSRFIDLLNALVKEYNNLTIILTSHSPNVINKIDPYKLYMVENIHGKIELSVPNFPSYIVRMIYEHDGYDYIIFVEDILARYVVEDIIKEAGLNYSRLIKVIPVGGWRNVIAFHTEAVINNLFGVKTTLISVLDGDVKDVVNKEEKARTLCKLFLPVPNMEKYIYSIITEDNLRKIKKKINDEFFKYKSMDELLTIFYKNYCNDTDNNKVDYKKLYTIILNDINERKISEDSFIKEICTISLSENSFSNFKKSLCNIIDKK